MNTDWFDLLFRNSFSHQHTLSVSGANERVDFYFSAGYADQQGALYRSKRNALVLCRTWELKYRIVSVQQLCWELV